MKAIVFNNVPTGTIIQSGSTSVPAGYLYCNGQSVNRADYPALFSAIGTAYGSASGTTFNVPDLRGRFVRGQDNGAANDPDAAGRTASNAGGATGDNVGTLQGHAFQTHAHNAQYRDLNATAGGYRVLDTSGGLNQTMTNNAAASGGKSQASANETRPVNLAVRFYIKV